MYLKLKIAEDLEEESSEQEKDLRFQVLQLKMLLEDKNLQPLF